MKVEKAPHWRFSPYDGCENIKVFASKDENLKTLEPLIIESNCSNAEDLDRIAEMVLSPRSFKLYKEKKPLQKKKEHLERYIKVNASKKVDFAMKIFDSSFKINYPRHLKEAIDYVRQIRS